MLSLVVDPTSRIKTKGLQGAIKAPCRFVWAPSGDLFSWLNPEGFYSSSRIWIGYQEAGHWRGVSGHTNQGNTRCSILHSKGRYLRSHEVPEYHSVRYAPAPLLTAILSLGDRMSRGNQAHPVFEEYISSKKPST